ncbi:MAG: hypothetical protein C0582_05050 [Alphaproteobacteria bacterium]|nr:MAG: hypothetical protein C0582_05050 [Alphaproteobacteria bacterium]
MKWMLWIALMVWDGVLAKGYQELSVQGLEYEYPVPPSLREAVLEEFDALKDGHGQMVLDDSRVTDDQKQTVLNVLPYIFSDQWRIEAIHTYGFPLPGQQSFLVGLLRMARVMDLKKHIDSLNLLFHQKFSPVYGLDSHTDFELYRYIFFHNHIILNMEGKHHLQRRLRAF